MNNVNKPKIIIAGWHDDSNKGDAAILLALLRLLDRLNSNADFYIQLSVHYSDKLYTSILRHTTRLFHKPINDLTSLFNISADKRLLRICKFMISLFRSFILLLFPQMGFKVLLDSKEKETLFTYFESACIVGKGGHYFYGGKTPIELINTYIQAYPFLLARRLKIPYVLIGISVGPYSSWVDRIIPKLVFSAAAAVSAREIDSFEEIRRIVGSRGHIYKTTDTALWLYSSQDKSVEKRDEYVILCPRVVFPRDRKSTTYARYLEISKWLINELTTTYHRKVLIVLNAVRPSNLREYKTTEDDAQFISDLKKIGLNLSSVNFFKEDIDAIKTLSIFAGADFVIGTRLHSIIFALLFCKPFIAISYYGPKMNILKDFDMQDYIINIDQLSSCKLKKLIENLIVERDKLVQKLEQKIAIAKEIVHNDGALQVISALISHPKGRKIKC